MRLLKRTGFSKASNLSRVELTPSEKGDSNDPISFVVALVLGFSAPAMAYKVIAASFVILAVQLAIKPVSAQIGGQCGYTRDLPCYITIISPKEKGFIFGRGP